MKQNKLSDLPLSVKTLAVCFIISILIGYGVALVKIYSISEYSLSQALLYYRGDEAGLDPLKIPQSFGTLLSIAHVHTMSQPFLFALLGLIFCATKLREKTKAIFILIFFFGILFSNASPWLVRYGHPAWILLFPLSQLAIFVSMMFMTLRSLKDLCRPSF